LWQAFCRCGKGLFDKPAESRIVEMMGRNERGSAHYDFLFAALSFADFSRKNAYFWAIWSLPFYTELLGLRLGMRG
jgi:hypothetical protein